MQRDISTATAVAEGILGGGPPVLLPPQLLLMRTLGSSGTRQNNELGELQELLTA